MDFMASLPGANADSNCLAKRLKTPRRRSRSDKPPSDVAPPSDIPESESDPLEEVYRAILNI